MTSGTATQNISGQLTKLREEEEAPLGSRASLFNLVFYCEDQRRTELLQTILQATNARFPCRIIFIQGDSSFTGSSPNVKLFNKKVKDISCDHIHITVSPQQLNRIPFIVLPYLLPDLQLFLIWGQNPVTDDKILPHLLPYASRLIFDADEITNFNEFSKEILEMINAYPQTAFIDINWTLTLAWRQILRQIFDNPITSEELRNSYEIQIHYNNRQEQWLTHANLQAFYLSQWLASRMEWISPCTKKLEEYTEYSCTGEHGKCKISLKPEVKEKLFPGTIFSVEINSIEHQCFIAPYNNAPKVVIHISHQETCELPFTLPLQNLKPGFPFVKELFFEPFSTHYKEMLKKQAST